MIFRVPAGRDTAIFYRSFIVSLVSDERAKFADVSQTIAFSKMKSPAEIVASTYATAETKTSLSLTNMILLGFLAGVYIAMGGTLATLAGGGFGAAAAGNPVLPKLLSGFFFPLGIILVVIAGAELFTGNCAVLVPAAMQGKVRWGRVLLNWGVVWCANFLGALFWDYFLVYLTGLMEPEAFGSFIRSTAETKASLSWGEAFVRGVGANWFVCLAIWLATAADTMSGKMMGLWCPVMAFVVMGFEHSIANMYYIPTGMMYGAEVSLSQLLLDNLLPVTLGNIVGGALFVGALYGWIYGRSQR